MKRRFVALLLFAACLLLPLRAAGDAAGAGEANDG